ncbi:MAG: PAAR domain-containing protein [Bryobacteraceae bacterium]|nr:PAAR domain-containing protein [Bryobacteraceae bacterium]
MPLAARVGDPTGHPGVIAGPGAATVLIGGMPAATLGDMHTCSMPPTAGPHPPSPIVKGSATVFAENRPLARMGDMSGCGAPIIMGFPLVVVGG